MVYSLLLMMRDKITKKVKGGGISRKKRPVTSTNYTNLLMTKMVENRVN